MLDTIYYEIGATGMFVIMILGTLSVLSWVAAMAGVTVSDMPRTRRLTLQLVLTIFPFSALVILAGFIIANGKANRASARLVAQQVNQRNQSGKQFLNYDKSVSDLISLDKYANTGLQPEAVRAA